MRKISLLFIVSIFVYLLTACANEQDSLDINTTSYVEFNQKSKDDLKDLYLDMINSQEYIDYENSLNSFILKMNFDGDINQLNKDNGIIKWIALNTSKTTFKNIDQAKKEWETTQELGDKSYIVNSKFFESLQNSPGKFPGLLTPITNPISNYECEECTKALVSCTTSNSTSYGNDVDSIMAGVKNGSINGKQASAKLAQASVLFELANKLCKESFDQCCIK